MNRLVVLYVTFLTCTVAFAQQPNEWRPALAADNKSASLADTLAFLSGIALTAEDQTIPDRGELFTKTFESPSKCQLKVMRSIANGFGNLIVDSMTLDLSNVDPLLVSVRSANENGKVPFWVALTGTNNIRFAEGDRAFYNVSIGARGIMAAGTVPCPTGKTRGLSECRQEHFKEYSISFPFGDIETAKRLARGMMHAALVCGGPNL
jgi:hypothetical protein